MKAAQLHDFGEPLRLTDVPPGAPGEDEIAVRLEHASVNPLDIRLCEGGAGKPPLPFVPGCDGVGHTDDGPVAVHGGGIGTLRAGTFAQQIVAPRAAVVPIPDGVDLVAAAAIGLVGATASYVVRQTAGVTAADRVLVLGVTGAVGMLAVQIAVATGATVWAQSGRHAAEVDGLGADRIVVTDATGLRAAVRELRPTVVIDGLGGEFTAAAVRSMTTGGRLALYGVAAAGSADIDLGSVYRRDLSITGIATRNLSAAATSTALTDCLALAAAGKLRPIIADRLPLREVNTALTRLAERGTTGKLLLTLD